MPIYIDLEWRKENLPAKDGRISSTPYLCGMDLQIILVFLVFSLAVFWLGRMFYRNLTSKKGCASNCGKCAADFSNVKIPETKS